MLGGLCAHCLRCPTALAAVQEAEHWEGQSSLVYHLDLLSCLSLESLTLLHNLHVWCAWSAAGWLLCLSWRLAAPPAGWLERAPAARLGGTLVTHCSPTTPLPVLIPQVAARRADAAGRWRAAAGGAVSLAACILLTSAFAIPPAAA